MRMAEKGNAGVRGGDTNGLVVDPVARLIAGR